MTDWKDIILNTCEEIYGTYHIFYSRSPTIVNIRKLYCYLCRVYTNSTLKEIGRNIGVSHGLVSQYKSEVEDLMKSTGRFLPQFKEAERLLDSKLFKPEAGRAKAKKVKQTFTRTEVLKIKAEAYNALIKVFQKYLDN